MALSYGNFLKRKNHIFEKRRNAEGKGREKRKSRSRKTRIAKRGVDLSIEVGKRFA